MRSERAKIFAPFSPLKSMNDAYRKKEKIVVPRAELLTDRIEEIDRMLRGLKIGDNVNVTYYENGEYKRISGQVHSLSPQNQTITVGMPIRFDDIYRLSPTQTN